MRSQTKYRESHRHTGRPSHRPHRACQRVRSRGEAAPECSDTASRPHGSARRFRHDRPRRGLPVSPSCHTAITNWADRLGPKGSDLQLHASAGLTQTPLDGLYNLCHVVPSEGPRIRTGASSGPSKRYCRVFGGVSLTPQTLSRLTKSHTARGSRRLDAPAARLVGHCRRPRRSRLSLSACTRAPDAAWPLAALSLGPHAVALLPPSAQLPAVPSLQQSM